MEFEFDKHKSEINLKKHGIDFIEAKNIWNDPDRIEIPAKTIDEERFLIIGKISDKYWSCIITYR
ncbi:MAG: BrnT family toxin, partial [Desulfobacterales bacterium]